MKVNKLLKILFSIFRQLATKRLAQPVTIIFMIMSLYFMPVIMKLILGKSIVFFIQLSLPLTLNIWFWLLSGKIRLTSFFVVFFPDNKIRLRVWNLPRQCVSHLPKATIHSFRINGRNLLLLVCRQTTIICYERSKVQQGIFKIRFYSAVLSLCCAFASDSCWVCWICCSALCTSNGLSVSWLLRGSSSAVMGPALPDTGT